MIPSSCPGIYIHIPFCRQKCAYCDFSSFSDLDDLHIAYVEAVIQELARRAPCWSQHTFGTIYVGGGTPTVLPPRQLGHLLSACQSMLDCSGVTEITVEANPGTVSAQMLAELSDHGVNRLSLGVQSFDDAELAMLGRIHSSREAFIAFAEAQKAGFSNISLDLIFGLPNQNVPQWRSSLEQAIALRPEHLSLYALTLEPHTPLYESINNGVLPEPDEEHVAQMYELAEALLATAGYTHYEISNWARRCLHDEPDHLPQLASRHNLVYWRNALYLGLGAAAYSFDGAHRNANVAHPTEYIRRVKAGQELLDEFSPVDAQRELEDTLMLGLRLLMGVRWDDLQKRFGFDVRQRYASQIDDLVQKGLLVDDSRGMRLSKRGHLIGNQVFGAFL